jgi:hypothetical protein
MTADVAAWQSRAP